MQCCQSEARGGGLAFPDGGVVLCAVDLRGVEAARVGGLEDLVLSQGQPRPGCARHQYLQLQTTCESPPLGMLSVYLILKSRSQGETGGMYWSRSLCASVPATASPSITVARHFAGSLYQAGIALEASDANVLGGLHKGVWGEKFDRMHGHDRTLLRAHCCPLQACKLCMYSRPCEAPKIAPSVQDTQARQCTEASEGSGRRQPGRGRDLRP